VEIVERASKSDDAEQQTAAITAATACRAGCEWPKLDFLRGSKTAQTPDAMNYVGLPLD